MGIWKEVFVACIDVQCIFGGTEENYGSILAV
jgi:hypothetical protein